MKNVLNDLEVCRLSTEALRWLLEKATPGPWKYVRAKRFTQGSVDNGIPCCTPCKPTVR